MPCHLSGKLRFVSASSVHVATFTDSSPVGSLTTSPSAPIQSPSDSLENVDEVGRPLVAGEKLDATGGVVERAEGELALLAAQHEPTGDRNGDAGLRAGLELAVVLAQSGRGGIDLVLVRNRQLKRSVRR